MNNDTTTTIWDASLKSGLSELHIWILIRNKIIPSVEDGKSMMLDFIELRRWITNNRNIVYEMQLDCDIRDPRFKLRNHILRLIKKVNTK